MLLFLAPLLLAAAAEAAAELPSPAPAPPANNYPACSPFWPAGSPKEGCWVWDWQFSFHPVTTSSKTVGDSSGGLLDADGVWHTFYSCTGGWCHLSTKDLVHYESHGIVKPKPYPGINFGMGTGSVVVAPDKSILGYCNNQRAHIRSTDNMETWAVQPTTTGPNPGGRDQAKPLQSADGSWFQMAGCGDAKKGAAVCRFRATDGKLNNWTYDGAVYESNSTWAGVGGNWIDFYEVPDFFPLTNAKTGTTKHVLVVDPWGQGGPGGGGYHVHNVEWRSGVWSADGRDFTVEKTACLDYGWWYAARSISNFSNTGRRLMSGNIGTDVTHGSASVAGHVPGASGIRMFTSLPREVQLADDGQTVHVKPPAELAGLRAGPATTTALPKLKCGDRKVLGANVSTGEFELLLDVSTLATGSAAAGAEAGLFFLASPQMEEAVYVGYNGTHAVVDMTQSSQDNVTFQASFRAANVAPFPVPASGVVQLHVFFDHTVVELFASDCVCSGPGLVGCDCTAASKTALAVTGLAFPLRPTATGVGVYMKCVAAATTVAAASEASAGAVAAAVAAAVAPTAAVSVAATVNHYPVIDSPVACTPPTCTPGGGPSRAACPPKAGIVPYMTACKPGDKGQQWMVSAAGVISSVAAPTLALGTARPGSVELVPVTTAQPFLLAPNLNLYFNGTYISDIDQPICLDSHCGNARPGDCSASGVETYPCCSPPTHKLPPSPAQGCACNQMWRLLPVTTAAHGPELANEAAQTVTMTNGDAAAGTPSCHRTDVCLAVC